jgi:hypothetical protein
MRPLLLAAAFIIPAVALSQPQADAEKDVRAVVQRLFDGMRASDSAMARGTLATGVRFAGVDTRTPPEKIMFDTVDRWLGAMAGSNHRWDEQIYDVHVRIDDNLAQVWAPYTFYLDKKVSHCGIDAFDLLKVGGEWKITQLADTRRRENCPDPLKK